MAEVKIPCEIKTKAGGNCRNQSSYLAQVPGEDRITMMCGQHANTIWGTAKVRYIEHEDRERWLQEQP